jgi:bifunctional UDP-N-acetylglucosamine pyrophosphorylase/glucosamine-1-phosphate N-acetyltransferase
MDFQIIILAAGKGTRMNSALPKVLVGLSGKPLIQHLLDNIKPALALPPVIVVGFKYDLVQSYLGQNYIYAFQEGQFGTAHAAAAGLEKITAPNTLVLYGDMPFIKAETLIKLSELHKKDNSKFSMLTTIAPSFNDPYSSFMGFGRIVRDAAGDLIKIQELVDASETEKQIMEVNPGIYLFNTAWLKEFIQQVPKNKHGEHYLTDLMEIAIRNGIKISDMPVDPAEVFGVNTLEQLMQAEKLIKN